MFARLTIIHTEIGSIHEASRLFEESVIPAFRTQKGYQGAYFLSDQKTGKSICMSLWNTEQDALSNEQSHLYQEQLVKFMNLFTSDPYREGYELIVEDTK